VSRLTRAALAALLLLGAPARASAASPETTAPAPEAAPETTAPAPEAAPETSAAAPEAAPETSAATPEAAPETSAATPEAAPETSAATPEAAPETTAPAPRFRLGFGAGVGIPGGDDAERYVPGVQIALDFTYDFAADAQDGPRLALWCDATLALLPVDADLPIEPGGPSGLTLVAAGAGVALDVPVDGPLSFVFALALGLGAYGQDRDVDHVGLAILGAAGARWALDPRFAVRVDAAPQLILSPGSPPAGHTAVLLRGEARF